MAEMNNNETYQPMTFDAIKIGLASPEENQRVVKRRGVKTGNH